MKQTINRRLNGLWCNRFGAPGLYIVKHMGSAWDGERVYPHAISAIERVEENGHLLLDPSFTIGECDGTATAHQLARAAAVPFTSRS